MKRKEILKKGIIFLFAFFTTFALAINLDIKNIIVDKNNANIILNFILCLLFYKLYNKYYFKNNKHNIWFVILSMLFSIFMIFGDSFKMTDSWNLVFKSPIFVFLSMVKGIGYYLLFDMALHTFYDFITKNINKKINVDNKITRLLEEKPFKISIMVMIICWLPYIISFYPAILSPDPSFQIKQFMGIKTKYMDYSIPLDPDVTITNHHPVAHTVLLGGSVKIGHMLFNSTNIGLFIYSLIQITILVSVLAFTIKYMKKLNVPIYIRFMTLIIYSLVPVFPFYAMSAVKDVIFSALIVLYIIYLYDMIRNCNKEKYSAKKVIGLIFLFLAIMLIRNNGIYTILLSFPFLLLIEKKNRIKILMILIIPVVTYKGYTNILLPKLKITDGSIREMLSIPFQQTARYVRDNKNNLTNHEIEVIDNVLGIDDLDLRYKPEISDPVKNGFNKYTTDEELKEYFKVWYKGLLKRPDVYIQATINNTYGYFYPNITNWYIYGKFDKRLNQEKDIFNYSYNKLSLVREALNSYGNSYPYIPIIGLLVNIGFNTWLYMFMLVIILRRKAYKNIIFLLPTMSLVLVCIASPVNTYFRYAMPYIFSLPIAVAIMIDIIKKSKERDYE